MRTAKEAAEENAKMPEYDVMRRDRSMAATMAVYMPSKEYIAGCKWFTQAECDVYGQEYSVTGWTGALHNYRHRRDNSFLPNLAEQLTFSGRTIDVPAQFIAGKQELGRQSNCRGRSWSRRERLHELQRESSWSMAPVIGLTRSSRRS